MLSAAWRPTTASGAASRTAGSAGRHLVCLVSTGATDIWNNNNPQFLAYLNGALVCGLDVNHTEFDLSPAAAESQTWQLGLYAYCNTPAQDVFLKVETAVRDDEITGLYYDLKAPYEVLVQLDEGDTNAIGIGRYLEKALDMLDLRDPYSAAFYASVAAARRYMKEEFYESFCQRQPVTVDCVGHTHIDVAWLWTLAQTREKAIRSFATVNYLMDRSAPSTSSCPASRSSTILCAKTAPRCLRRSAPASPMATGNRRAACGWNPTATWPAARV